MKGNIMRKMIEARNAMGYSQGELADICGCSRSAIANIESGKNSPSLDLADRIALALNSNVYELFFMRSWDNYNSVIYDERIKAMNECYSRIERYASAFVCIDE